MATEAPLAAHVWLSVKKAVKDFASETSMANRSEFLNLPITKRYQSIIEVGEKAEADLEFFRRNLGLHSTEAKPKYVDVRIIVLKNNSPGILPKINEALSGCLSSPLTRRW
jgi:hypothetical protein